MNEYTIAKLVIDGELRSHNKDFLEICVTGEGYFVDYPEGKSMLIHEPLTVAEVREHIFRDSNVDDLVKSQISVTH